MSCREFENMAVLELSGDLSPEETLCLQDHLAICADCRRFTVDLQENRLIIQSWRKAVPEGEEECLSQMHHKVMKGTRFSRSSFFLWPQVKYFFGNPVYRFAGGMVAVVAISMGIGFFLSRPPDNRDLPIRQSAVLISPTTSLPAPKRKDPMREKASIAAVIPPPERSLKKPVRSGSVRNRRLASAAVAQWRDHSLGTSKPFLGRIELQTADPNIRIIWLVPDGSK